MDRNKIVEQALTAPQEAIRRTLTSAIRAEDPELYIVEVHDLYDEVFRFADKEHCLLKQEPSFNQDIRLWVNQGRICGRPEVGWYDVVWQGAELEFVEIQVQDGYQRKSHVVLMGKKSDSVRGFLVALDRFSNSLDRAVFVFQDGCWKYDQDLFDDIKTSTFENIVLPAGMAAQIRDDVQRWIDAKDLYEEHGVPWKRGIIFVGPPGNGKTHMIKALANHFQLNTLYVRGFRSEYHSYAQNIASVFDKARACAPALLVMEDLDTLVNAENRSYFLNELDGFARNSGVLTVASANDPARLDPALVNRPSRFDRRYAFSLPELAERTTYLQFFTSSLRESLRLSDKDAAEIAAQTDGFSFAYLKELVLSTMMGWISTEGSRPFAEVMKQNVGPLLEQMTIDPVPTPTAPPVSADEQRMNRVRAMQKRMTGK